MNKEVKFTYDEADRLLAMVSRELAEEEMARTPDTIGQTKAAIEYVASTRILWGKVYDLRRAAL